MNNITAQIVVKDGELTIEKSILSIVDIVDYIYVVDNGSTDNTISIIKILMQSHQKIKFFDGSLLSYANCRNLVIDNAPSHFILKWDCDFIALRKKYGADQDFGEILQAAVSKMESDNLNLCLFIASNIGFTFDCIDPSKEIEGVRGDIRMYRKGDFRYITGDRYADEFTSVTSSVRRHYLNKIGESPIGILHFNQLKDLKNFGLRDFYFEFDRIKFNQNLDIDFNDWLLTEKKIIDVNSWVISKVNRVAKSFIYSNKFNELYKNYFYADIFNKTPFIVEFNFDGSVKNILLKR